MEAAASFFMVNEDGVMHGAGFWNSKLLDKLMQTAILGYAFDRDGNLVFEKETANKIANEIFSEYLKPDRNYDYIQFLVDQLIH